MPQSFYCSTALVTSLSARGDLGATMTWPWQWDKYAQMADTMPKLLRLSMTGFLSAQMWLQLLNAILDLSPTP